MSPTEQSLHSICEARGILLTPIPTESAAKNRTPDFLLQIPEAEAVVELKQIDLNDDERVQLAATELGQTISIDHGGDVARFARKIRDANDQLKRKCNGRPGITVLMDARDWLARALSPQ